MTAATEILKTGMSTELWGQRFYREAVARTESEDGKRSLRAWWRKKTPPRYLRVSTRP